ncbi:hypothetical protein GCM10010129_52860 [Streptomyces fumigatiscleroticus]|nr:hypothetical protein GCM10010129_52860 [Streptomyces fumigatiscleroticus]
MGSTFQTIADVDAGPRDAPRLAAPVIEWLVAEGIVLAGAEAGWGLSEKPAHPPGPDWHKAVADPRHGSPEGVVPYTEHRIFDTWHGTSAAAVECPVCAETAPLPA